MRHKDFAIFICSHGRPDISTVEALKNAGYTGNILIVVDDEDDTYDSYLERWGKVIQFNKQHYVDTVDTGTDIPKRKVILYAKCACEDIAKEGKLKAFAIADDDFTGFRYRYNEDGKLRSLPMTCTFDDMMDNYLDFLLDNNLCMTSIGTNQMYMGGELTAEKISGYRIPYSFVFRNVSIPFEWKSELFEDVISETLKTQQGYFMMQMPWVQLNLKPLYAGADGGMTDVYQSVNFVKRLFSVVQYLPSAAKVVTTHNSTTYRLMKENAFPKLVSSCYRK